LRLATRQFFSIPPSSIASEVLFSKAGLIYGNKLRKRLTSKTLQQILLIKSLLPSKSKLKQTESKNENSEDEEEFELIRSIASQLNENPDLLND
jgi:hypothetical protein